MKKIPTLFEREFENHRLVRTLDKVTPGFEWVLNGDGIATIKYDGSCCAVIDGKFYVRYDAKAGRKPPEGAIPCCDPDSVTGHWPNWLEVDILNPQKDYKWFVKAFMNTFWPPQPISWREWNQLDFDSLHPIPAQNATYEAIGPHFNNNPYHMDQDRLIMHGQTILDEEIFPDILGNGDGKRTFEGIRTYLENTEVEGIVFWKDGEPRCKIKRRDFGFEWPIKEHDHC